MTGVAANRNKQAKENVCKQEVETTNETIFPTADEETTDSIFISQANKAFKNSTKNSPKGSPKESYNFTASNIELYCTYDIILFRRI